MSVKEGSCLQCHESKEAVKANKYFCATMSGYEYREVDQEWEKHHWRDWSDSELKEFGIHPDLWNANRRTDYDSLQYVWMESQCLRKGHVELDPDDDFYTPNRCERCFLNLKEQREAGQEVRMQERTQDGHSAD